MFSYKGIDNEYKYKRGIIEAFDEIEAINKIKDEENVLIIVNMKKISDSKFLNKTRVNINNKLADLENQLNLYVQKLNEKTNKNEYDKKLDKKAQLTNEAEKNKSSHLDKSPILKFVKKIIKPAENTNVIIDEEMYNNLQFMFKEHKLTQQTNQNVNVSQDNLSNNKISDVRENLKKDTVGEKSINWNLLDDERDNDPAIKNNRKIKVNEKEILMFTKRLHIMLSSGVSLLSSLTLLQKTSGKNMTKVLKGVLDEIELGNSFSESISKYPNQFNYAYVSLVAIGETSGSLDKSLKDIIKLKEQEQKVSRKVRTASIYPMIVGFVLTIMMVAASIFFLPKFQAMYEEQELSIPVFTKIVFTVAGYLPYIIIIIGAFLISLFIAKKKIPEVNYIYKKYVDKIALKLPILKDIMISMYMHSFASTISLMLGNGIRLSDTLSLTGKTINNIYLKNEIEDVGQLMTHGLTFSEALREQLYFDDILINITLTGEESGSMVFSLAQVAEYFEIELNKKVDAMMEVIPPLSIALIALIAAPVIIAAYLPILEISSGAGLGF